MAGHRTLRRYLEDLVTRQEGEVHLRFNLKAGLGAFLAILVLGLMLDNTGLPLLIAPFGASSILLFGRPEGTLAQPVNVVAGYTIAALVAFATAQFFPGVLWATAVSTGLSLVLMRSVRVTHPPAGAIPLLAFAEPVAVLQLLEAVIVGSVTLVALALAWHRLPPRQVYPRVVLRDPFTGRPMVEDSDD